MAAETDILRLLFHIIFLIGRAQSIGNSVFGKSYSVGTNWCYGDDSCDEHTWDWEECESEKHSPIDLPPDLHAIKSVELVPNFPKSRLTFDSFMIDFRGMAVHVNPGGKPFYFIRENGSKGSVKYRLHALDFHWGSDHDEGAEHTIDGKAYEGEVHMMFYDEAQFTPETADVLPDEDFPDFLVIAIFLDQEHDGWKPTTYFLDPIVEKMREMLSKESPEAGHGPLNLTGLFRGAVGYRYKGTFTAPGCKELEWWILRKPVVVPKRHMKAFRNLLIDGGEPTESNYRRIKGNMSPPISLVKFKYV